MIMPLSHPLFNHILNFSQIHKLHMECIWMSWWSGWGSKPTWNASHIHSKHIQIVWHHSYIVHGHWDPWSCHYHVLYSNRFLISVKFIDCMRNVLHVMVPLLRLQTHMECFPHPLQTYKKCLTSFLYCGWALGSMIMPLSHPLLETDFGFQSNS